MTLNKEEKKAIERANEILKEWQKIVDIEDDVERDIEMSMYSEEMPFHTMKTLLNLVQKQESEINKLKEELDITKCNYELLQGEMDRIGIDTLHLEAGNSTDDVIDEINKLNNVIDRMAECIFILRCWAITSQDDIPKLKQKIIEEFMKESEQHGRKENQNK